MKLFLIKIILIFQAILITACIFLPIKASAARGTPFSPLVPTSSPLLLAQGTGLGQTPTASDGAWLTDPDVTFAGKTASRAASLFNWVLVNYKWSYGDNTLIAFWSKIRNIVYAFLVLLVIITAFTMIITGGQSITAIQFLRKFLVVLFLITLSFAFIRFFYQVVDIITGFFVRNPDGDIISSKDLFNMSFGYENFIGWRRYGPTYDESAFVSLLLVKITAVTYYVMAGILIVRKVILWFFITVSPIYPILLLYFPIRNTAKIWLGEFFRWLLYAPLFTIFLSGLVYLYRDDINVMNFNFTGAGNTIVYPTAINILLGGPGQRLDISNSVNYNDTFAEYIIALIMVWVVIFLPFLLLRIFLDYLSNISINKDVAMNYLNNAMGYIVNKDRLFINRPQSPISPKTPPSLQPTGSARTIPFSSGSAKEVAYGGAAAVAGTFNQYNNQSTSNANRTTVYNQTTLHNTNVANLKRANVNSEALHLVNFPIPTMRDVARFETSRISNQSNTRAEVSKVRSTLEKIANPYAIQSSVEREHFSQVREKLFQAKLKGDQVASSILNAANNEVTTNRKSQTSITNITNISNAQKNLAQTIQKLANPEKLTSLTERAQFTTLKQQLTQESHQGNILAQTILTASQNSSVIHNISGEKSMQETLQKIAHPESLTNPQEKQKFKEIKNKLVQDSKNGNPVADSVLKTVTAMEESSQTQQKVETPAVNLPTTNQVQTVNLDDYENVKKMWLENYRKISVPKTIDQPNRSRQQWIKEDSANINRAISLLISGDQQKVAQGMSLVSNILPFLLIGGFSQSEVIAYLKAKEVAGETVLKELTEVANTEAENESLVSLTKRKSHRHAAMHDQLAASLTDDEISSLSSNSNDEDLNENPIAASINRIKLQNQQIVQILQTLQLNIPSIKDVARAESAPIRPDTTRQNEVIIMQETLQKIANPEQLASAEEREHFTKIKEQLIQAKSQGDTVAISILNAAGNLTNVATRTAVTNQLTTIVQGLNHSEIHTSDREKEVYKSAKETLEKQAAGGNNIAQAIMTTITNVAANTPIPETVFQVLSLSAHPESITDTVKKEQIIQNRKEIEKESEQGDPVATAILHVIETLALASGSEVQNTNLPSENQVQTVNLDDYENVKKLWIDNYVKAEVPKSLDKPNRSRQEWISADLERVKETINLLTSQNSEKVSEGMANVSNILPFLLIGGFSQSEIIAYLKAKQVAAEEVLRRINEQATLTQEDEDTMLSSPSGKYHISQSAQEAAEVLPSQESEVNESASHTETNQLSSNVQKRQEDEAAIVDASLRNNQEMQEGTQDMRIKDIIPAKRPADLTQSVIDEALREPSQSSDVQNESNNGDNVAEGVKKEGSDAEYPPTGVLDGGEKSSDNK